MKVEELLLGSDLLLLLRSARIGPVALLLPTVCLCWETNSVCRETKRRHAQTRQVKQDLKTN